MRRSRMLLVVASIIGMLAAACSSKTTSGGPTPSGSATGSITAATTLNGAGSTFAAPLYNKWAGELKASNGIQVNYQPVGSGQGISNIIAKQVDFGATDAVMNATQTAQAPAPLLHIPTAFGAVVVTYNIPGVTTSLKLTGQTIADIFSKKITKWNDAAVKTDNPGVNLPGTAIVVVHRSDSSGTTSIFTSYLTAVSPSWASSIGKGSTVNWPAGTLGGSGNSGVAASVKQNAGAVGYVELTYSVQNNLPAAEVQNADKSAFVAPSVTSTTSAGASAKLPPAGDNNLVFSILNAPGKDSYPIAGPTWILAYKEQTNGPAGKALVDFIYFGLTTGQKDEAPLGYAPLPDAVATRAIQAVNSITYNGTPLRSGQ